MFLAEIFISGSFFLIALFAFMLWKSHGIQHSANKLLLVFLICCLFLLMDTMLHIKGVYFTIPQIANVLNQFAWLLPASMFMYSSALMFKDYKWQKALIFHSIPFIAVHLVIFFKYHLKSREEQLLLLKFDAQNDWDVFLFAMLHSLFVFYVIAFFLKYNKYKRLCLNEFSEQNSSQMKWLRNVYSGMVILWLSSLITTLLDYSLLETGSWLFPLQATLIIIIFSTFSYFGIKQVNLPGSILISNYSKSERTKIPVDIEKVYQQNLNIELEKKIYLQPGLTLQDLSEKTGIARHDLSQLINDCYGCNFNQFINKHRIEYCLPKLGVFSNTHLAAECGFNSRTAFYSAFKKYTGKSPKEYMSET